MQNITNIAHVVIRVEDELQSRWCFVVVKFVAVGLEAEEAIFSAEDNDEDDSRMRDHRAYKSVGDKRCTNDFVE